MASIVSVAMEAYVTRRGPTLSFVAATLRDLVLVHPQKHLRTATEDEEQNAPVLPEAPKRTAKAKAKAKACVGGKEMVTFRGSPPPDPHAKWAGQQDATEIPNKGRLLEVPPGFPDGLLVIEDDQRRRRIIVPSEQRERLVKQEHLSLLHVGSERVTCALTKRYYWHKYEQSHQEDRHAVLRLSGQQDAFAEAQPRVASHAEDERFGSVQPAFPSYVICSMFLTSSFMAASPRPAFCSVLPYP
jgi:hypothetical protein